MGAEFPVHPIASVPLLKRHTELLVIADAAPADGRVKRTVPNACRCVLYN